MRAVLLFARHPQAERRAKGLPHAATAIFRRILQAWRKAAAGCGSKLILASTQRGDDFGERLANSVDDAFASGATALLVAGIDTPPPSSREILKAFQRLESGAVPAVIGPATDGGIYLIGLRCPERQLLRSIRQGQSNVMDACREYFRGDITVLATVPDLDSNLDLRRLEHDPHWYWYRRLLRAAQTFSWLEQEPAQPIRIHAYRRLSSRAPPPFLC